MGLAAKVGQGVKDFRKGLSVIFGKPKPGEGDRKLARMAIMVEGQIDVYGKRAVRTQVIKSIENDMKRTARKGKEAVDALMDNAFSTPEYMRLLGKIGLDESHVRVMAMEALKKYAK
jgi:hypothetical protein